MSGQISVNLIHFARLLRAMGLKIGPRDVLDAHHAVMAVGFSARDDLKATLRAVFVRQYDQIVLFDQAFEMFWRKQGLIEKLIAAMGPQVKAPSAQPQKQQAGARRLAEALSPPRQKPQVEQAVELDARLTASDQESLHSRDFAQMSAEELALAQKALARLRLPDDELHTRRMRRHSSARRIDPRAMLRLMMRSGGHSIRLAFRAPRLRAPPIVALCDISGSMNDYTRMFLHFLHALGAQGRKIHVFLFGTRLTNVTRALRRRDIDDALAQCAQQVVDWNGGTRIGASLAQFNRLWSRRVLGQGAHVILFTDGLERDGIDDLEHEIERLSKSCRRLIWLNPLLRYDQFEPKARGIRAMLPYVDDFRSAHNLNSFDQLIDALSEHAGRAPPAMRAG
jgi:uncharacterized protein